MKKIMSILMAVAMLLAMVGVMGGCGSEPADNSTPSGSGDTNTSDTGDTSDPSSTDDGDGNVFPSALANIEAIAVPGLELTGWTLAGGMVDGVEMEEADLQSILDACGGAMQFVFTDASNVTLTTTAAFEGTYEVVADGYAVHIQIPNYEYYGVFTKVQDTTVMIIANSTDDTTALYFSYIDEH